MQAPLSPVADILKSLQGHEPNLFMFAAIFFMLAGLGTSYEVSGSLAPSPSLLEGSIALCIFGAFINLGLGICVLAYGLITSLKGGDAE